MFISSRQNRQIVQSNTESPYHDSVIKSCSTAKLLGVTMFSDLKWVSFPERVIHIKAIQMFKTIRGDAPEYLRSTFTFTSDIHARLLRSSSNFQLYTTKPHLEIYRNTFVFSGSSVWNEFPTFIYS